jgi:hypothetical protein
MITAKVTFDNGDYTFTRMNGSRETVEKYYLGRWFNLGAIVNGEPVDDMHKVVKVEFDF